MNRFLIFASVLFLASSAFAATQKYTVRVGSKVSYQERAKSVVTLESNKLDQKVAIPDKEFVDYSLVVGTREVKLNGKSGYAWLELTLKDKSGKTVAYTTATFPASKLSVGLGLNDPKNPNHQLILSIDNL